MSKVSSKINAIIKLLDEGCIEVEKGSRLDIWLNRQSFEKLNMLSFGLNKILADWYDVQQHISQIYEYIESSKSESYISYDSYSEPLMMSLTSNIKFVLIELGYSCEKGHSSDLGQYC